MAALAEALHSEIVPLRHIRGAQMETLLSEEVRAWRERLHWDFASSAELVRRYLDMHSLDGFAMPISSGRLGIPVKQQAREVGGYIYYVVEDHKALIGDLYVSEALIGSGLDKSLLDATIEAVRRTRGLRRIECQLMMLRRPVDQLPGQPYLSTFPRYFMLADLRSSRAAALKSAVRLEPWDLHLHEASAHLIAECYEHHIDSRINDQYRNVAGSRRFLSNIMNFTGCGSFFAAGSLAAIDASGALCGVSLSSMVGSRTGHITQISVAPGWQGRGIGRDLLTASLDRLQAHGCREVSLTVTESNLPAIRLYETLGFRVRQTFPACVWEGWN